MIFFLLYRFFFTSRQLSRLSYTMLLRLGHSSKNVAVVVVIHDSRTVFIHTEDNRVRARSSNIFLPVSDHFFLFVGRVSSLDILRYNTPIETREKKIYFPLPHTPTSPQLHLVREKSDP